MDAQLLEHLVLMRDTYRFDARHCGYDMEQQRICHLEYQHYEARIDQLWRDYEGSPVVPARYRTAREAAGERRRV